MKDFYNRNWNKKRNSFTYLKNNYHIHYKKDDKFLISDDSCFLLFSKNKFVSFKTNNIEKTTDFELPEGVSFKNFYVDKDKVYLVGFCLNNCELYCYDAKTAKVVWNNSFAVKADDSAKKSHVLVDENQIVIFIGKKVFKLDPKNGKAVLDSKLSFSLDQAPAFYDETLILKNKSELYFLNSKLEAKLLNDKVKSFVANKNKLVVLEDSQDIVLYDEKKEKSRILRKSLSEISGKITDIVSNPKDENVLFLQLNNNQLAATLDLKKEKLNFIIHNDLSNSKAYQYKMEEIIPAEESFILRLYNKEADENWIIYFFYDDLDYSTCDYRSGVIGKYVLAKDKCLRLGDSSIDILQAEKAENYVYANVWIDYLNLPKEKTTFEGVDLSKDLDKVVIEQLGTRKYAQKFDSGASDWFEKIINRETIAPSIKCKLRESINNALTNPDSEVRAFAVSTLDVSSQLRIESLIIRLVINNWELFKGLKKKDDPKDTDRGSDALRLVTALAGFMEEGFYFAKKLATDKKYGASVLAGLASYRPDWVVENIDKIITNKLDPEGKRLDIVFFNINGNLDRLKAIVKKLKGKIKDESLKFAIKEITDQKISDELMDVFWGKVSQKSKETLTEKKSEAKGQESILNISDLQKEYADIAYTTDLGEVQAYNEKYPDSPGGYFFYGITKLNNDEISGADELFTQYIKLRPADPRGYYQRSIAYIRLHEWKKALVDLKKVLSFGEFASVYEKTAYCFYKLKQYEKAAQAYQKACKINPDILYNCIVEKSQSLLETKGYQEVIKDCNRILETVQERADIFLFRGLAYLELDKLDLAQRDFAKAVEISHDRIISSDALLGQGRVLLKKQDYEKALEKLKEALSSHSANIKIYQYLAECYKALDNKADEEQTLKKAQYAKQVANLEEKLNVDPKNPDLLFEKGKLYLELALPSLAKKCFDLILEIDENNQAAYLMRAKAEANRGNFSQALNDYDTLFKLKPDFPEYLLARGNFYFAQNKYAEAEKDFLAAAKVDSKNAEVYLALGSLHYRQNNLDEALKYFDKALELDPKNAKARSVRGDINVQTANYEQAIEDLSQAIKAGEYYGIEYLNRATAYKNLGQEDKELADLKNYTDYLPRGNFLDYYVAKRRGELLYKKAQYVAAEKDFEYFAEGYPSDLENKALWGICLLKNDKDLEKALEFLTEAAENYVEGYMAETYKYDCLLSKAVVLMKLAKYEAAAEDLSRLQIDYPDKNKEIDPLLEECLSHLKGSKSAKDGKASKSKASTPGLEQKLKALSDKVNEGSATEQDYIDRGNIFYESANYEAAVKDFLKVIAADFYKQNPALPEVTNKLALSYKELGNEAEYKKYLDLSQFYTTKFKEMADVEAKIEKNKKNFDLYAQRAKLNLELTRYYPAIEDFEKYFANKGDKDPELQFLYAKALMGNVSYSQAIEVLDKVIKADPKNPDYIYHRGLSFIKTKDYDKALADLEAAEKLGFKANEEFKAKKQEAKEGFG